MRRFRISRPSLWLAATAAAVALWIAGKPWTNAAPPLVDGPPPAVTGGFGEETCRKCHFDFDLNDPAGSLRLEGLPQAYAPGTEYTLTVRLTHPRMERGGFELASRVAGGNAAGRQGGELTAIDARSKITINKETGVQYALQTRAGSAPESKGAAAWQIRWKAPDAAGEAIVFHLSANAANYDDSPLGDYPYATSVTTSPARR